VISSCKNIKNQWKCGQGKIFGCSLVFSFWYNFIWLFVGFTYSTRTEGGFRNARWYSSWALVCTMAPIVIMHFVWIILTLSGKLVARTEGGDQVNHRESVVDWNPLQSETDVLLFGKDTPIETPTSSVTSSLLKLLQTGRGRGTFLLHDDKTNKTLQRSESSEGLLAANQLEMENTIPTSIVEMIESNSFRSRNRTISTVPVNQIHLEYVLDNNDSATHPSNSTISNNSLRHSVSPTTVPPSNSSPLTGSSFVQQLQQRLFPITRSKDSSDRLCELVSADSIVVNNVGLILDEPVGFDATVLHENL
jgi:hypothetical protein